jgi:hypothetical protein
MSQLNKYIGISILTSFEKLANSQLQKKKSIVKSFIIRVLLLPGAEAIVD